ncbi:sel1 repeat family protein [Eikenella sp. S3360]|uniref:Sel1 repeat family protein n=1 Tax=Eikenella glucosivorans TaxID=2766967 RepID=A0ABS0N7G6_9NEIS|nr:tetratricopeptide repeat protein [Eikenella glucosivorans]MBH5328214.1 sel1 repeat family protein [Eikenella glucosivorans]
MNPKSLYRAALLEYLYYASLTADPAEAGAACRTYRRLARKGCPDGWFGLGRACQYGYGVKPNPAKAEKYYRRAAKLGHAEAQEALGCLYEFAEKPDYRHARKWYARALEQHSSNSPDAAYRLGYLYEKGLGGKKDFQTACLLYRKAAKAGHPDAQRALGYCYEKGLGLPRNDDKARKWYARAALQADADACNNLGFLHYNGKGVRRNKSLAGKWYKLAARAGSILALSNLGVLYEDAGRLKKAVRYYRRAAEAGNKYAARQLKRLDK